MTRRVPFPCPQCGFPLSRVIETLPWQGTIRRRRRCENGHVAETREALNGTKTLDVGGNRAA